MIKLSRQKICVLKTHLARLNELLSFLDNYQFLQQQPLSNKCFDDSDFEDPSYAAIERSGIFVRIGNVL